MAHSVHITTNAPAAETQSVAPEPAKKSAPPKSSAAHQDNRKNQLRRPSRQRQNSKTEVGRAQQSPFRVPHPAPYRVRCRRSTQSCLASSALPQTIPSPHASPRPQYPPPANDPHSPSRSPISQYRTPSAPSPPSSAVPANQSLGMPPTTQSPAHSVDSQSSAPAGATRSSPSKRNPLGSPTSESNPPSAVWTAPSSRSPAPPPSPAKS